MVDSPSLRNKKVLIEDTIDRESGVGKLDEEWSTFVAPRQNAELTQLLADELRG